MVLGLGGCGGWWFVGFVRFEWSCGVGCGLVLVGWWVVLLRFVGVMLSR